MKVRMPAAFSEVGDRLNDIGFERTRRALAALGLSAFVTFYLLLGLLSDGLGPALAALAGCYAVAFVAVVAEWFWGRWFATGIGWSGIMLAITSMAVIGWNPVIGIIGGIHVLVVLALSGKKMAARYDLQEAWRLRYQMDEFGVARLQKTVTRAAASLPSTILWALAPKEGQGYEVAMITGVAALAFAALGLRGVVRLRSWGVLALGAAAAVLAAFGNVTGFATAPAHALGGVPGTLGLVASTVALLCLVAAVAPFARPVGRFLARR